MSTLFLSDWWYARFPLCCEVFWHGLETYCTSHREASDIVLFVHLFKIYSALIVCIVAVLQFLQSLSPKGFTCRCSLHLPWAK